MEIQKIKEQYENAEASLKKTRDDSPFPWTDREALFLGVNRDKASEEARSNVNTQDLQNLVIDGASRVCAQLPTGKSQVMTKIDRGKNQLMNLLLDKHVLQNPYALQYQWDIKLRMWDMYSRIYGAMPMLATWRVDKNYIGPDAYLIHPRHFRPQAGKTTIQECDYGFVDSWVSASWLKQRDSKVWKNIGKLLDKAKDARDSKMNESEEDLTYTEQQNRDGFIGEEGKFGQIKLTTQYVRDRWVTFSPDHDIIVRDISNQNNTDQIPVIMKQCYPLIDRIYGLAEFERGQTLQNAINGLVNLYMDGVKMSIFPPIIMNSKIVPSSIKYQPGAKWMETEANAIRNFDVMPKGIDTFTSTYSFLKSALLNMGASSDTSISSTVDPGMGKTPQALQMQESREGARDAWDRHMLESAYEDLMNVFVNMFGNSQEKTIKLDVFKQEIEVLKGLYKDENILEVFTSGEFGQAKIIPDVFKKDGKAIPVRFFVDAGSSAKQDDQKDNQALGQVMALVTKNPAILQQLQAKGMTLDMAELFKRWLITSGTQDWDKILVESNDPQSIQGIGPDTATIEQQMGMQQPMEQPMQSMGQMQPQPQDNQLMQ